MESVEEVVMNKGEAAEVYVWLRLALDRELVGARHDLQPWPSKQWPILSIVHSTAGQRREIEIASKQASLVIPISGKIAASDTKLRDIASEWLNAISCSEKLSSSMVGELERSLYAAFPDLRSSPGKGSNAKSDLYVTVEEPVQHLRLKYRRGLSVKSAIGSDPTLVNASRLTRFRFHVSASFLERIAKTPDSALDHVRHTDLTLDGLTLGEGDVEVSTYENNLGTIDSQLPQILAWLLVERRESGEKMISVLCERIKAANPLKLRTLETYRVKILEFLVASALDMVPSKRWLGKFQADGGVVIVRPDGSLATFFIIDSELREQLDLFLFECAYLETPSRTKHDYGTVYKMNGSDCLDLCLQVRLKTSLPKKSAAKRKR
jgi:hypothetical protein